jgi:hypothetical protein
VYLGVGRGWGVSGNVSTAFQVAAAAAVAAAACAAVCMQGHSDAPTLIWRLGSRPFLTMYQHAMLYISSAVATNDQAC